MTIRKIRAPPLHAPRTHNEPSNFITAAARVRRLPTTKQKTARACFARAGAAPRTSLRSLQSFLRRLRSSLRRLRSLIQGRQSSPRSPRSVRPKSSRRRFPASSGALQSVRTSNLAASQRTAAHFIASALRTWPLRGFGRAPRRVANRTLHASTASSQPPSNCVAVSSRSSAADYEKRPAVKE